MHNFTFNKFKIAILFGVLLTCFVVNAQNAVPFTQRTPGGIKVKGDVMLVGNHILNRSPNPNTKNDDLSIQNNSQTMEYINIDNGATLGIFSSSSANLAWPIASTTSNPQCYRVVYAGLYWASIYPFERSNDAGLPFTPSGGSGDNVRDIANFKNVKIKLPFEANYQDLTADQTIFDGFGYYGGTTPAQKLANSFKDCPVICYKDITSLVQGLSNPEGAYTLANIRAVKGKRLGGGSAGWVMVVIYENLKFDSKFISTFDGYSGVNTDANINKTAEFDINNFTTLPSPFQVNARLGIAALEGDLGNPGDGLTFTATTPALGGVPRVLSNGTNPNNDFFNSTITYEGNNVINRSPASLNTLGFDIDMLTIPNPPKTNGALNSVIPNNTTGAKLKLTTSGDGYGAFLTTFAVDIIAPKIVLTKTVKRGNDNVAGQDVGLGDVLDYIITFQNIGNDSAKNFTIRDILPVNTTFQSVQCPPGVTYNPVTSIFTIADNLVTKPGTPNGGGIYSIKLTVQVATSCNELTDQCENKIQNTAYATYRGVENTDQITDDPSVSTIACNAVPGPVNFLVNVDNCKYERTAILCQPTLVLTAGGGYASYQWYRDAGVIGNTADDVTMGINQNQTVSAPGEYYVINTPTPPCVGLTEHITVVQSNNLSPINPVSADANTTVTCVNNGIKVAKVFLCGKTDTRLLHSGGTPGTISWEKFDKAACQAICASCITVPQDCPHNDLACINNWIPVTSNTNFTVADEGEYRLVINSGGCKAFYYFNVFKNNADPQIVKKDAICGSLGEIKVTGVSAADYEFRLLDNAGTELFPYSSNPVFPNRTPGTYKVEVRQLIASNGNLCTFSLSATILQADLTTSVNATDRTCNPLSGTISIGVAGMDFITPAQQYIYTITSGSFTQSTPLTTDITKTFTGLNPGTYTVKVTTDGGCLVTKTITIDDYSHLTANAQIKYSITCDPGVIKVTASGGKVPYNYYDASLTNPTPTDYNSDGLFTILAAGSYSFTVIDANGCKFTTAPITISKLAPPTPLVGTVTNVKCNGGNDGTIIMGNPGAIGPYTYDLVNGSGTTVVTGNTDGNFTGLTAGNYTVKLLQTVPTDDTDVTKICPYTYTFTIVQPAAITVAIPTVTPYNCPVGSGATITVPAPTGGTSPYKYSLDGVNFGASTAGPTTFTGVTEGTYTIKVKDANGCEISLTPITIVKPLPPTVTFGTDTAVKCPTLTSTVTVSGTGTGNTYQITAPASAVASNTTGIFNLPYNTTYTFVVTSGNGCSTTATHTVKNISRIDVDGSVKNDVACFGSATGALEYNVSGFANNYKYTITGPPGFTTINVTSSALATISLPNLAAGNYTIVVTDLDTDCNDTKSLTIGAPTAALTATAPTVTQPTCTVTTGTIDVNVTGGWGGNTYSLAGPTPRAAQPSNTFAGLAPGIYTATVTDSHGCIVTITNIQITAAVAPTVAITGSDLCLDGGTSLSVAITGGKSPYQFKLDSGTYSASTTVLTKTYTGLLAGSHTVTVLDANGCTATTATVTIAPQLTASIKQVKGITCNPAPTNAQIELTISGGKKDYQYQVSTDGGTTYTSLTALIPANGNVINYYTATAATYTFKITDALGCSVIKSITVAPKVDPEFAFGTITDVLCYGSKTGELTLNIDNTKGVSPFTYVVTNTDTAQIFGTQTTGLPGGNYSVTVTDSNGCTVTHAALIKEKDPVAFTTSEINIQCVNDPANPGNTINAGEINVQGVTGGTAPYTYTLTNNFGYSATPVTTTATSNQFIILNYGIYEAVVTDANGCTAVKSNIIMASPPNQLAINVSTVPSTCSDGGTAIVTVGAIITGTSYQFAILEFNTPPYTSQAYVGPDNPAFPRTATFTNLVPGVTYTFVVYDLSTHCYYFESKQIDPAISDLVVNPLTVNPVACTGSTDGSVDFNFTVGSATTSVTYQVYKAQSNQIVSTPGASGTVPVTGGVGSGTATGLAPGVYYVQFEQLDGNTGCKVVSAQFTIKQSPVVMTATAISTKNDNTCTTNGGKIVVTGHDGSNSYVYQVVPKNDPQPNTWVAGNSFDLEAGFYDAYVKDSNGCIKVVQNVEVKLDALPTITADPAAQCNVAEGNFVIDVNRTDLTSVGPYTYSLNGGAFESQPNNFSYTNLNSGTYIVTIKDGNGCTVASAPKTIYPPLNGSAQPKTQPICPDNGGEITADGDGGSGNYEYSLETLTGTPVAAQQLSDTFTGLTSGNYKVIIHDMTTLCTTEAPVSLDIPVPVTFTAADVTVTDVTCNTGSDGSIEVTLDPSNTEGPYTYSITGGTPPIAYSQSDYTFVGLKAGAYDITIASGKGCSKTLTGVNVNELPVVTATASATPFACAPDNTVNKSTITVNGFGGTGTYTYSIDGINYFPTDTFEVANDGINDITINAHVKDENGCEALATAIVITHLVPLSANVTKVTDITCNNAEKVTVAVTGGIGDFEFRQLPSTAWIPAAPGARTFDFDLPTPDSYTFEVHDITTSCTTTTTIPYVVPEYNLIKAVASVPTPVTCFTDTNGTITVDITNYTGPYTYEVFDSSDLVNPVILATPGSTNHLVIGNLSGGNYVVRITATNTPFCSTDTNAITIASPSQALVATATDMGSVQCTDDKGKIVASAVGGWPGYLYKLERTTAPVAVIQNFAANLLFEGLSKGDYKLTVRDAQGCEDEDVITLALPAPIAGGITPSTTTTLLCHGDQTATIEAVGVSGGQQVYQYQLITYEDTTATTIVSTSGEQTDPHFYNIGAGTYGISIKDGWGCTPAIVGPVTITEPDQLIGNLSLTQGLTCTTQAELTITGVGGTSPYQYSTDGGFTYGAPTPGSFTVTNLPVGTYHYYVKDANNCTAVLTNDVTVDPLPTLTVDAQLLSDISCNGNIDGQIAASATGGLGNYVYTLYDTTNAIISGPNTTGNFTDLAAGNYYVHVQSGDCPLNSTVITVTNPTPLVVIPTVTPVTCFGDSNGKIKITASGGTGTKQYAIVKHETPPLPLQQFDTINEFTDLEPGDYDVIVQDENGCYELRTLTVTMPERVDVTLGTVTDETCLGEGDATVEITVSGGTGAYKYSLDYDEVAGTGNWTDLPTNPYTITGLPAGSNTINLRDGNLCLLEPALEVTIQPGVKMDPTAVVTPTCVNNAPNNDVTITILPIADPANVTYSIDNATWQSANVFTNVNLTPGTYIAYARHIVPVTLLTCIQRTSFTIDAHDPISASAPSFVNVLCHGDHTGTITVTATGGTGNLQYAIADASMIYGTYQLTGAFTGLAAGNYSISIIDENNCELIVTQSLTEPAFALAATAVPTDEICFNANDGTITVAPSGGTAPYQVNFNGIGFTSAPFVFNNLTPGTYTVVVKDANGCTFTATPQTIAPGVDLQASIAVVQVCDQATVTVSVNPALASVITYSLDNGPAQPSNVFVVTNSTVIPAAHTITVIHPNGCEQVLNFTVKPFIPMVAAGTSHADALCFGEATGSATVTVTGGTLPITYAIADAAILTYGTYQSSNTFTGLAAGNYVINAKDALGCELASTTITVGQPTGALTATTIHTDEICFNANDGTITVAPSGGTAPYQVNFNGIGFTAAPFMYNNLTPGTYTVVVKDANGCTFTATPQTVAPGVDLQASINVVQVCDEATITVSVNPAEAANVTYELDGILQASNVIVANGLTPTQHTITVIHTNTCTATFTFNVAPVIPMVAGATSHTDALCFGEATGSAIAVVTGGTLPIEYAIADAGTLAYGTYQSSNTFTGLAAGNYVINAKDNLGCELASITITIGQPTGALTATATSTDEICNNANDGTITVAPSGGTSPYQVNFNETGFTSAPFVFNNLADGTYTIEVKDANGCTFTATPQTVAPGVDLMASIDVIQVCDEATVTVSVNPALASVITYSLDGGTPQTSNVFVVVNSTTAPVAHTITVMHPNTCEQTLNFNVDPVIPIVVNASTIVVTPIACHGQNSGSIEINATGGTGPLQYALTWNIWPTQIYGPSNTFTDLLAGTYTVWVKDAMGCVVSVQNIIIDEPADELTVAVTSTPEVCINDHNGTITITAQGGTAPYSTAIDSPINFQEGVFTYAGLFGGNHDVFVRDARGCYVKTTINVEKGVNLNPYTQTALSCNNNLPVNTVTILLNPVVQNVKFMIPGVQDTFLANNTFDLAPGTYTVTAQHINGCEKTTTFTVQPRPAIVPSASAVAATCFGAADGKVTVTATGGTGILKYGISPNYVMGSNPVFTNLLAGNYTIRVEDAYGCYVETQATVGQPAQVVITVVDVLEEVCANDDNGAIEISVAGGTAPYAASLDANGPFVEDQTLFDNLNGGITYTVYVKDAHGCISTIDVPLAAPININADAQVDYKCDSNETTVTIVTDGSVNTAELTYTLEGPKGNNPAQTSNVFSNLEDGGYTVEVIHTVSGCTDTVQFTIISVPSLALSLAESGLNKFTATAAGGIPPYTYELDGTVMGTKNTFVYDHSGTYKVTVYDSRGCSIDAYITVKFIDITLPDVVSPDQDGTNDTWSPGNTANYPNINTDIFDRYGRKLATLRQGQSWDATYDGSEMPTGDYWYLVKLGDAEDRQFVGHFTIYR